MKKLLATTCFLFAVSISIYAGDIPGTGKQEPPPCTANCSSTTDEEGEIPIEVVEIILNLLTLRP